MKVYYAHCMNLYGSKQEARDTATLEGLGFTVVNPSIVAEQDEIFKHLATSDDRMAFFERYSEICGAVAFRALNDGAIPAGVAKEIEWFVARNKPVLELPSGIKRRVLTVDMTREFLAEIGQR